MACLTSQPVGLMPWEVPLPPSPPPAEAELDMWTTTEKKYPDLKNIGFPSLDDEVTCLISQPVNVVACDVPLPPSPPATDAVLEMGDNDGKKDPDIELKHPNLPQEVPLLASPPLAASGLRMRDNNEKKYPDLKKHRGSFSR